MPGNHREWDVACKIFIGGLRDDANRYDIEDVFNKYGGVRDVWVARKPPGFAFVEMEDPRDAEDAARGLDGSRICGARVRVEMSEPGKRRGKGGGSSRGGRSRSRSGGRGGRRRSPSYSRGRRSPSYSRGRRSPSYTRGRRSNSRERRRKSESTDRRRSVSRDRKEGSSRGADSSFKREDRSRSRS
jgi:RNA recognition motif-containing protein